MGKRLGVSTVGFGPYVALVDGFDDFVTVGMLGFCVIAKLVEDCGYEEC